MGAVWGTASDEPLDKLSEWDTVSVGLGPLPPQPLPGLARVHGKGLEHRIDIKKCPGKDGATFTDLGRELAQFTITLVLTSQSEWDSFVKARATLQALLPTGQLQALPISHPALNSLGIRSVYFTRVGVPHPGSVVGTFEVELEALELRAPTKTAGSGTPKKDVKNFEKGGNGYAPKAVGKTNAPSKTNTGPD
jgi:hypothetical protein